MYRMDKLMNMPIKVNNNLSLLSPQEKKDAHEKIMKACTKKIVINTSTGPNIDLKRVKSIFNEYYGGEYPLLDINEDILGQGYNPLMMVSYLGNNEELKILLKLGANPSIFCGNNFPPLHLAVSMKRIQTAELLLINHYKEIRNLQNQQGQTPLMLAAEAGSNEIVKMLVQQFNADVNILDNKGLSVVEYAKKNKYYAIEDFLRYFALEKNLEQKDSVRTVNKI